MAKNNNTKYGGDNTLHMHINVPYDLLKLATMNNAHGQYSKDFLHRIENRVEK
jgi:hypothetical protein